MNRQTEHSVGHNQLRSLAIASTGLDGTTKGLRYLYCEHTVAIGVNYDACRCHSASLLSCHHQACSQKVVAVSATRFESWFAGGGIRQATLMGCGDSRF